MAKPHAETSSIYQPQAYRLLTISDLTPQEKLFRLQLTSGKDLRYQPGQFVQVSIPGLTEAPISIASSPTRQGYFELAVRRAGTLTGAMHQLEAGSSLGIRGPFGRPFQLDALYGKQLLLIAGGCGLAPLRSLIQYCFDRPEQFASVNILYGARSPQDLLFRQDLDDWQLNSRFNCRYTVDNQPANSCFDGETGLITELLEGLEITPGHRAVVVGPPAMYRPVLTKLKQLGLTGQQRIMLSLERQMRCGIGKCGHCCIEHLYCCTDGPVLSLIHI